MKTVYLALGSNMGDRERNLDRAVSELEAAGLRRVKVSGLYETEPVGLREQAWFLNAVSEFQTELFPAQLLRRIQRIERELGRKPAVRNGPRLIDIDILFYAGRVIRLKELEIPHPRFRERRFVLAPLAEIAPHLIDPVTGHTSTQLLAALNGQLARRL